MSLEPKQNAMIFKISRDNLCPGRLHLFGEGARRTNDRNCMALFHQHDGRLADIAMQAAKRSAKPGYDKDAYN